MGVAIDPTITILRQFNCEQVADADSGVGEKLADTRVQLPLSLRPWTLPLDTSRCLENIGKVINTQYRSKTRVFPFHGLFPGTAIRGSGLPQGSFFS